MDYKFLKLNKTRIILWTGLLAVIIFIVLRGINPSGQAVYETDLSHDNYNIGKLSPDDRLATGSMSEIISNPVYFSLRTLRRYNQAKLIVEYVNNSQPIIESGVLADNRVWRYNLQPLENKIIDQLANSWEVIRSGDSILLQRQTKYNSIDDFLQNPPDRNQIALYNYPGKDIKSDYLIKNYEPKNNEKKITQSLRGNYQFFTYIKNEELNFELNFFSLNKNKNSDSVDVDLYYENTLIDSRHLDGQKEPNDWGNIENLGAVKLKNSNLPEGVYKIVVNANDDVVTNSLKTTQTKLSFINRLWLYGDGQKNFHIYTDSAEISFNTVNPGSLQEILLEDKKISIDKTYKQFSVKTNSSTSEIKIAKDDIILAGNGVFSFDRSSLINANWKQVDKDFRIEGVDYVLAKYSAPVVNKDIRIAQSIFDLHSAYSEPEKSVIPFFSRLSRRYSFMLSIPSLRGDGGEIVIKKIRVELER